MSKGKKLLELLHPERRLWYGLMASCPLVCLLICFLPLLQRNLIDAINSRNYTGVIWALGGLGGAVGLSRGGTVLQNYGGSVLMIHFRDRCKKLLFSRLLGLPPGFLQSKGISYLSNRVHNDVEAICRFGAFGVFQWLTHILKMFGALVVIGWMQWWLGLLVMPFLLLQVFLAWRFLKYQYKLHLQLHEATAQEQRVMHDFLSCHNLLRSHNGENIAEYRHNNRLKRWKILMFRQLRSDRMFRLWQQLPVWFCCCGVFLAGLYLVWHDQWTLGDLWAVTGLLILVFTPVRGMIIGGLQMQSVRAAVVRLSELLEAPGENQGSLVPGSLRREIEFSGVDFGYPERPMIFQNFELRVAPGEKLLLTGPNGCGKSTLLALLLRFYIPAAGEIRIDGIPVEQYELAGYRGRIGYIGQTMEFFPGTLRDNLLLGRQAADHQIEEILGRLHLSARIQNFPGGLDGRLEEAGHNFSAGERLRLALARELLRNPDILLLDEVTANLDAAGEQLIWTLLRTEFAEITVIMVAHHITAIPEDFRIVDLKKENSDGK